VYKKRRQPRNPREQARPPAWHTEQFTDALVRSYKAVAERGASAQEHSAHLTEVFFNQTIDNLRAQAEQNRQASQRLAEQQRRQADAAQTLTRESVDAYTNFVDSVFSYWRGGIRTAEWVTEPGPTPRQRGNARSSG
jgi:hypothetical protein